MRITKWKCKKCSNLNILCVKFRYRKENNRRRHNYTPFVIELMKILAKEGKLVGLVDNAYQAAKEKSKLNTDITKLELKRKQ